MTHVLIVEDHEENRDLLKVLLEANGYRVTAAGDGLEALAAARRDPPDVVVSDALMPRMDGFALCREWMRDAGLKAIPFIFYSATYVHPQDEQFATALGAVRYLIKPLEAEVFLGELRAVLQQWAGHAAPAPAAPLDDLASRALHESALARKVEDKITQLEAAKRELRGSEQSYRRLFDANPHPMWVYDLETLRFLAVNEAAVAHYGYSRDEFLSMTITDIRPPEDVPRLLENIAKVSDDGIDEAGLWRHRRKDGTQIDVEITSHVLLFEGRRAELVSAHDVTQRLRAEAALVDSEAEHRVMFEGALDGILVADAETRRFVTGNPEICRMLGYTLDELAGISVSDIHPKRDLPRVMEQFDRQLRGELQLGADTPVMRKDGSVFYADVKAAPIRLGGKDAMLGIFRDITERKAAEARIQRLTQLYAALSQCNKAIVRCVSEEELFPQICRVAVEFGGMKSARISLADPDTATVRVVATSGYGDDELQDLAVSLDGDSPFGRGPTGTAIREQRPIWCEDFMKDGATAPWHERGARLGWGAVAALPLRRNGVVIGAFVVFEGEANAFDEPKRELLLEMATDIGFALDNFAREAARARADMNLRAAEEQFRGLVEQSIAGIYIIQDDKLVYANPRLAEIFGYASVDELIGRDSISLVVEKDRRAALENRRRVEGGVRSMSYGFTAVRKDGALIEVGVHATRATHKGRPAIIGLLQDISEKKRAEEEIRRYIAQIESAFMSTVRVVTTLGEMRDPYTAGHQRRVAEIAVAIGAELGLDPGRLEGLRVAGYLHDIGKLRIPSEILSKPGKLSPIEFKMVQGHAQAGFDALKDVTFPWPVAEVALQHHERMDGSGYPQGLKGEEILYEARIMAVANLIDALCSHRPYRAGFGIEAALAEIERGRGELYDAEVAEACLRLFRDGRYQLPV